MTNPHSANAATLAANGYVPPIDTALHLLRLRIMPLVVPFGQKNPNRKGWQDDRNTEADLALFATKTNIGMLLGHVEDKDGCVYTDRFVDADLDCLEAVRIAAKGFYLPRTPMVWGRQSKPRSHYGYRLRSLDGARGQDKWTDPLREKSDGDHATLAELRFTGHHTLAPGSVNPGDGVPELVRWDEDGEPADAWADWAQATWCMRHLAAAALTARYFHAHAHHFAAGALGRVLYDGGMPLNDAVTFMQAVCVGAEETDEETTNRVAFVRDTYAKLDAGEQQITGAGELERLGMAPDVLAKVREWLGLRGVPAWDADPLPLPDALPPVAPFTSAALLPPGLSAWVDDAAERMQAPPDFLGTGAVALAGALLGRRVGIYPKHDDDWLVLSNLWTMAVGRPSSMKTPAQAEVLAALQPILTAAETTYQNDLLTYEVNQVVSQAKTDALKEELKAAARAAVRKQPPANAQDDLAAANARLRDHLAHIAPPPTLARYLTNDSTIEKLAELLLHNPAGLLMYRDELSGWLHSFERLGREGDRAFYLEAWNGTGSYRVDRIARGSLTVPALCVAVMGSIQPGPLARYVGAAERGKDGDDGLLQRFSLLAWPDPPATYTNVDRAPNAEARAAAYAVYAALAHCGQPNHSVALHLGTTEHHPGDDLPVVRFTPAAQAVFDAWRDQHENRLRTDDLPAPLEAHLVKFRKAVPALALIFQAVEDAAAQHPLTAVDTDAVARAVAWCPYLESHARRLYSARLDPDLTAARRLLRRLQAGDLHDGATVRDLYRHHWSGLDTLDTVDAALRLLERYGWVRVESQPTGGHPRRVVRLHPALLDTPAGDSPVPDDDEADTDTDEEASEP